MFGKPSLRDRHEIAGVNVTSADLTGILTLILYASIWIALTIRESLRCPDGPKVWGLCWIVRVWIPLMFSVRIQQHCPFPLTSGALFIANHRSPVDPLFILASSFCKEGGHQVRLLEFMTAREYVEMKGPIGWICRAVKTIPVDRNGRDLASVKEALRRLQAGKLIGIFPEGRINKGDGLLSANPGVAWLALRAKVPVFPVFVHGMECGESMITPFHTPRKIKVSYGEPIDLSEFIDQPAQSEMLVRATELMRGCPRPGTGSREDFTR